MVLTHRIVIDRPRGTAHPRYPERVYPLDYGYLSGTTTVDGGGVDIFVGGLQGNRVQGILCTVDSVKHDAEIKILYNCSEPEIQAAISFLNSGCMSALFVRNADEQNAPLEG